MWRALRDMRCISNSRSRTAVALESFDGRSILTAIGRPPSMVDEKTEQNSCEARERRGRACEREGVSEHARGKGWQGAMWA